MRLLLYLFLFVFLLNVISFFFLTSLHLDGTFGETTMNDHHHQGTPATHPGTVMTLSAAQGREEADSVQGARDWSVQGQAVAEQSLLVQSLSRTFVHTRGHKVPTRVVGGAGGSSHCAVASLQDRTVDPRLAGDITNLGSGHALAPRAHTGASAATVSPACYLLLSEPPASAQPNNVWRYASNGLLRTDDKGWRAEEASLRRSVARAHAQLRTGSSVVPPVVQATTVAVARRLQAAGRGALASLWERAYPYTLQHTTLPLPDGTVYVLTGDIELMWLRDSAAQVSQYVPLVGVDPALDAIVEGVIQRQAMFIRLDPYATSFRLYLDFDHVGKSELTEWDFKSERTVHVAMHNFELDNLAYFLKLSRTYFDATGGVASPVFDHVWLHAVALALRVMQVEQDHQDTSIYTYPELPLGGRGSRVCRTGMVWCGHRPSDDKTKLGYLIPSNMFAMVELQHLARMLPVVAPDATDLREQAEQLARDIDDGIHEYAVDSNGVYAYEVDGCGDKVMMDDANLPSLLSMKYLGFSSPRHDPDGRIAAATRAFVLSPRNPTYVEGKYPGVGSPHTPKTHVWHLALAAQALTATDDEEFERVVEQIVATASGGVVHEGYNVNNPSSFTRPSFAWANSLVSELVLREIDRLAPDTEAVGEQAVAEVMRSFKNFGHASPPAPVSAAAVPQRRVGNAGSLGRQRQHGA